MSSIVWLFPTRYVASFNNEGIYSRFFLVIVLGLIDTVRRIIERSYLGSPKTEDFREESINSQFRGIRF